MQECIKCKIIKDDCDFTKNVTTCKACKAAYLKEWRKGPKKGNIQNIGHNCKAPNCEEPASKRGLCRMHYDRLRRTGSLDVNIKERPPESTTIKKCTRCYLEKNINDFYNNRQNPKYKLTKCIQCCRMDAKNNYLLRNYNMTLTEYNNLLEKQNYVCKICKRPSMHKFKETTISLAVDHCHTTNKIRGLLCNTCNRMLGFARDDYLVLESAINYLKENE